MKFKNILILLCCCVYLLFAGEFEVEKEFFVLPDPNIISITFLSDHGVLRGDDYELYGEPEWDPLFCNSPITHSKGEKIKLRIQVEGLPIGIPIVVVGTHEQQYLSFQSQEKITTGSGVSIDVEAKGALPNSLSEINEEIDWTIIHNGTEFPMNSSGPHRVFVLNNAPVVNMSYDETRPTLGRLLISLGVMRDRGLLNEENFATILKTINAGFVRYGNSELYEGSIWTYLDYLPGSEYEDNPPECQATVRFIHLLLNMLGYNEPRELKTVYVKATKHLVPIVGKIGLQGGGEGMEPSVPDPVTREVTLLFDNNRAANTYEGVILYDNKYYAGGTGKVYGSAYELLIDVFASLETIKVNNDGTWASIKTFQPTYVELR